MSNYTEIKKINQRVETREKKAQKDQKSPLLFASIFATVIAPILEAITIGYLGTTSSPVDFSSISDLSQLNTALELQKNWELVFDRNSSFAFIVLAITVLLHIIAAVLAITKSQRHSHYFDYKELSDTYNLVVTSYGHTQDRLSSIVASSLAISLSVNGVEDVIALFKNNHNEGGEFKRVKFSEAFGPILWPFVQYREKIFGYNGDSLYNFAIYIYEEEQDVLRLAYRECDNRINTQNRDWQPGKGHVGITFMQKGLRICNDVAASTELSPSEKSSEYYKSFVSVPILAPEDDESSNVKPIGVLVVTSSHIGQFEKEIIKIPLETLAKLFGIVVHEVELFYNMSTEGGRDENSEE
ncbi:GAF domain-containing protein [Spongiibacter marinus]|uniref:GAF domain-containing protein n=1 Tax=Spongiibacter marinus TaxID=354246 RepID=UPI0035BE6864